MSSTVIAEFVQPIADALNGIRDELRSIRILMTPPTAQPAVRSDRCEGVPESLCGLRDDDAQLSRKSFSDPLAWNCKGCGYEFRTVSTT